MKCESCSADIPSTMRGALQHNRCPYCSGEIMSDQKAEQYYNLLESLDQTTFTNRGDVDAKIREKVANLLITNYIFMKVEVPEADNDIIVVEDSPAVEVKIPKLGKKKVKKTKSKKATRKATEKSQVQKITSTGKPMNTTTEVDVDDSQVRSMPVSKTPKLPPAAKKAGLSLSDFTAAQESIYSNEKQTSINSPSSNMTPEEIMKTFPNMSVEEAVEALREEAANMNQYATPQKGLTGKGIKRL